MRVENGLRDVKVIDTGTITVKQESVMANVCCL